MKMTYPVTLLTAALLASGAGAWAQQGPEQRYLSVISLKVPPAKEAAFTEHYKTGAGAKAIRARMQANPQAVRWTLLRAVYAGDPAQEANYMLATVSTGPPVELDAAKRDEMSRSSTGMSYPDYMQLVRTMSDTVGTTLSHLHDVTPGYALAEDDYVVVRRLKFGPGKQQGVAELYRTVRLPMATEQVKAGNLKGWSFSHLTFPGGSSLPYEGTEVMVYKDLASAVGGPGTATSTGTGLGGAAGFAKLFPSRNYASYNDTLHETSTNVRTDLYRVVAAYQK